MLQIIQVNHLDNLKLLLQYRYPIRRKKYQTSIINNKAADNKTGNETTPIIAVTKTPILLMASCH
jgi:hypothetical protein